MYNPVEVCWFDGDMAGAPTLPGNTTGALINVVDACLVNGFNSQTLTTLVVSGGVATATKTSHGFWDHTVVQITGATPADLNGKKRITRIDANSFTFDAVGIANGTATGTIIAKMAPVGWTKTGTSTNAYYTKPSPMATPWAFQIDDAYTYYAYFAGRHITTGATFAYSTGSGLPRGSTTSIKHWSLYADGRTIHLIIDSTGTRTTGYRHATFNDVIGFVNNPNLCYLHANYGTGVPSTNQVQMDGAAASGTGGATPDYNAPPRSAWRGYGVVYTGYGTSLLDGSAAGSDGCFHVSPIELTYGVGGPYESRGILAGMFFSLHDWDCVPHGTVLSNVNWVRTPQLRGHKITVVRAASNGMIAIDITGPWYPTDRYEGNYRIYGTAKKQGAVGRFPLALMVKNSGQIIRQTLSAADGSFAFNNIDYLYQGYTVVEYDGEVTDPLNAAIADLVTPVAMP